MKAHVQIRPDPSIAPRVWHCPRCRNWVVTSWVPGTGCGCGMFVRMVLAPDHWQAAYALGGTCGVQALVSQMEAEP